MRDGIVPVMEVNGNNGIGNAFGGDWAWVIINSKPDYRKL